MIIETNNYIIIMQISSNIQQKASKAIPLKAIKEITVTKMKRGKHE